jgi:hypothetical protein
MIDAIGLSVGRARRIQRQKSCLVEPQLLSRRIASRPADKDILAMEFAGPIEPAYGTHSHLDVLGIACNLPIGPSYTGAQRRVLPIAELPFLAESEVVDEVELKARTD